MLRFLFYFPTRTPFLHGILFFVLSWNFPICFIRSRRLTYRQFLIENRRVSTSFSCEHYDYCRLSIKYRRFCLHAPRSTWVETKNVVFSFTVSFFSSPLSCAQSFDSFCSFPSSRFNSNLSWLRFCFIEHSNHNAFSLLDNNDTIY